MTRNNEKSKTQSLPSLFHVEVDRVPGGIAVLISDVRAIRDLNDTTALFRLKGGAIRVNGRNISLTVYENRAVEVLGGVTCIEIQNDKT